MQYLEKKAKSVFDITKLNKISVYVQVQGTSLAGGHIGVIDYLLDNRD